MAAYRIRYRVKGTGEFPIDMLRYSRSSPATSVDSQTIERSFERLSDAEAEARVALSGGTVVELVKTYVGSKRDATLFADTLMQPKGNPERARWDSFSWPVVAVAMVEKF